MKINAANMQDGILAEASRQTDGAEARKTVAFAGKVSVPGASYAEGSKENKKSTGTYQGTRQKESETAKKTAQVKEKMEMLYSKMNELNQLGLKKEEYSLNAADVEKIVTVIDQIQVKLSAYCSDYEPAGNLNTEEIEAVLGETGMAHSVAKVLPEYHLPATDENVQEIKEAADMASEITEVTKEQAGYLVSNQMDPTIENVYKAQHSAQTQPAPQAEVEQETWEKLALQVEEVLKEAELPITQETMEMAKWMLEHDIALDSDTLKTFHAIQSIEGPWDAEKAAEAIVQAMAEGKNALDALLTEEPYSAAQLEAAADKLTERVYTQYPLNDTGAEAIKARRQLEEIRLMMTREAAAGLTKKGIDIETESLEKLVEELRQQEQEYYKAWYQADGLEVTEEKLSVLQETDHTVEMLKAVPSYMVGEMLESQASADITLQSSYESGVRLKSMMEQAGESYEALMTKPMQEYGDSITQAFRNVDEILESLNLQASGENERAVKILAYNQMEITENSIEKIKELDGEYQYLLKNLTPRVTMHMIENHINPLETELHELNYQIEQIKEAIGPSKDEKYSEFLWKLEKQQKLPQEERDAYIGMYRLMNTVDRLQGAAIGALVKQDSEVTLSKLLTAARSRKARGMDVSVAKDMGMAEINLPEGNITDQLRGFMNMYEENNQEYQKMQRNQFKQLSGEAEALEMLTETEQTVTIDNLTAAGALNNKGRIFGQLFDEKERKEEADKFLEALDGQDGILTCFEDLEKKAKKNLDESIYESSTTYQKLEDMRLLYNTSRLMVNLAGREDYHIPMELQGEMTTIHLQVVHGQEDSGKVTIEASMPDGGRVLAEFQVQDGEINGCVSGDSAKLMSGLEARTEEFEKRLAETGLELGHISYITGREVPRAVNMQETRESSVKTVELYGIAKIFLETFRDLEKST